MNKYNNHKESLGEILFAAFVFLFIGLTIGISLGWSLYKFFEFLFSIL